MDDRAESAAPEATDHSRRRRRRRWRVIGIAVAVAVAAALAVGTVYAIGSDEVDRKGQCGGDNSFYC
jgi:ferric-dicitrate binding protein FerR (iron transport regulator)